MRLGSALLRAAYRREVIPARLRWWLAAAGMVDFARVVARGLEGKIDRPRDVVAELVARMFDRRWEVLRAAHPAWPDARAGLLSALYRLKDGDRSAWIAGAVGGDRSRALLRELSAEARWDEVTVHLGELLIVATEVLPSRMTSARKVLGDICFTMGAKYAERTRRAFGIPATPDGAQDPAHAIEVLRMSEYVFRVNPEHWSEIDTARGTGSLEGTACPWYARPGWDAGHCGIFGQFQAGISAAFGLKYRLSDTIPKRGGGTTCKIDLVPLPSRTQRPPA